MRNHKFVPGEYYHIYNRGTDKREIILDQFDLDRFIRGLIYFNTILPIGSIYELNFKNRQEEIYKDNENQLVKIIAYCINPNHFHLVLTPLRENAIEKFMQKVAGYTRYFNEKYNRNGVLFQGKFKSKHIDSNEYLLHVSAYVNMNNRDKLGTRSTKFSKSSLEEYLGEEKIYNICNPDIISGQFENKKAYLKFALDSWEYSQSLKEELEK